MEKGEVVSSQAAMTEHLLAAEAELQKACETLEGLFVVERAPTNLLTPSLNEQWVGEVIEFAAGDIELVEIRDIRTGTHRVPKLRVPALSAIDRLKQSDQPAKQLAARVWEAVAEFEGWESTTKLNFEPSSGSLIDTINRERVALLGLYAFPPVSRRPLSEELSRYIS